MKRRVLAWVTAAAMLITSVPGNAITAFAEEVPESIVAEEQEGQNLAASSEEVEDEIPAQTAEEGETAADNTAADELSDAVSGADEDSGLEVIEEADGEDNTDGEIESLDGLVEDFTVEEDTSQQDAFDEDFLVASEDDQSDEEELLGAAEDEDPEIIDITLNCGDPEEVFVYKEYSGHFMERLESFVEASYTTSDDEEYYVDHYDWEREEISIGNKTVSVLTDGNIGVLPYDTASGELILAEDRCWEKVLYDTSIRLVPYVFNSEEYDQFEDKEVTLTFPTLDSLAIPLQEGAVQTVESDGHPWYELEFGGDYRYKLSLNAEKNSYVYVNLFFLSQQGDYLDYSFSQYYSPTGEEITKVLPALSPDTRYYLSVSYESADAPMQFSIDELSEITGVSLSDTVIGTYDLSMMDWSEFTALCSGEVSYSDGDSYPLYGSKWWSCDSEGRPYLGCFTDGDVEVDIYILDKDTGDAIELNEDNFSSLEAGSYTMQAKCGEYTATADFTITEGGTVSAELSCDSLIEYELRGHGKYYIHSTLN